LAKGNQLICEAIFDTALATAASSSSKGVALFINTGLILVPLSEG
jgi:hypothetical protein